MTNLIVPLTKHCTKCGLEFPATSECFPVQKRGKYGLSARCRACTAEAKRAWRKANPDKVKKHKSELQKRHRASANARSRRYAERHPEVIKAISCSEASRKRARDYYHANRPAVLVKARNYRYQNQSKISASGKVYRATHSAIVRANGKASVARRRARQRMADGKYTRADLHRIYEEQEGRCFYCGIPLFWDIPYDIHADHVMPLKRGGSNKASNIVLACAPCNLSKTDKTVAEWQIVRGW